MIWVVIMNINMIGWKRNNPGRPVPLAMFAITATADLWAWAASGVLLELICILIPRAFGWSDLIDAAMGRTLFSVTLHAIVYFWLMPAYIALYTLLPQAAGGRLYSDTMGRVTFIMFLVFSVTVCGELLILGNISNSPHTPFRGDSTTSSASLAAVGRGLPCG